MTFDSAVLERVNGEWVPVHYEVTVPEPLFTKAQIEQLHANEKRRREHSQELDRDDLTRGDDDHSVEPEGDI